MFQCVAVYRSETHCYVSRDLFDQAVRARKRAPCVLQGVAGCCRVLQGVAGCCRVLQGVAGCRLATH